MNKEISNLTDSLRYLKTYMKTLSHAGIMVHYWNKSWVKKDHIGQGAGQKKVPSSHNASAPYMGTKPHDHLLLENPISKKRP